jgi:hypothetical protein
MSPFDYLKSINVSKDNMMRGTDNDDLAEQQYKPFLINRGLSYFQDTIMFANEMNLHTHCDNKLQYEFLLNTVRPKKRFSEWFKKVQSDDVESVMEYYGYSHSKAIQACTVLSQDNLITIKKKLEKGG